MTTTEILRATQSELRQRKEFLEAAIAVIQGPTPPARARELREIRIELSRRVGGCSGPADEFGSCRTSTREI